jgi:hypothetical protein
MLKRRLDLPTPELRRNVLMKIKLGEMPIDEVRDEIDESLARVERFAACSDLPEKVDRERWDDWLFDTLDQYAVQ